MKLGIIVAMEEELSGLNNELENKQTITTGGFTFFTGKIDNVSIILLQSGVGKVNVAIASAILLDRFKPDYLVNTGSAGGFSKYLSIGDIVLSTKVSQHDVDVTAFGYEKGQVPGCPLYFESDSRLLKMANDCTLFDCQYKIHKGLIVSGDLFLKEKQHIENVFDNFPDVIAGEMEGGAVAQACYRFNTPFLIIRSISDLIFTEGNEAAFKKYLNVAAANSVNLLKGLIKRLDAECNGDKKMELKKIDSFTIDHTKMHRGIFVSRKDRLGKETATTFDIRMKLPNREKVLNISALHTIEHLGATFLRNHSEWKDRTVYFGPMGCRTGFYLIFHGNLKSKDVKDVIKEMFLFISDYNGDIPGATEQDCGNFRDQDLEGARQEASVYLETVLENMKKENLYYPGRGE